MIHLQLQFELHLSIQKLMDIDNQQQQEQKKKSKKKVGDFVILFNKLLGQGSFGDVYLGYHKDTNQQLAVKVFNKQKMSNRWLKMNTDAIIQQISIMQKLNSPNIIKFRGAEITENNIYVFQQLANNGTLDTYLKNKQDKRLEQKQVLQVLSQLLNGFKELINNGIMHRDIKLKNVLVQSQKGQPKQFKIADFGMSRNIGNPDSAKTITGTPIYMAPQILKAYNSRQDSKCKYTEKCDIWSLGILTYVLIVGYLPWKLTDKSKPFELQKIIKERCNLGIQFPSDIPISENLKDFIKGCLQFEQENRFNWNQVFNHKIFENKFKGEIHNDGQFLLTNLRVKIHTDNINLEKLISKFPQNLSKKDFFHLLKSLDCDINEKEADSIFRMIVDTQNTVLGKQILNYLEKHNIIVSGFKQKTKQLPSEKEQFELQKSIAKKLEKGIEAKNVSVFNIFKKYDLLNKLKRVTKDEVKLILQQICTNITNKEVDTIFRFFNSENTPTILLGVFYEELCQIIQIPAVKDELILNQIKKIQERSKN